MRRVLVAEQHEHVAEQHEHIGERVKLAGWLHRYRRLGRALWA
jgi:aspartyl-tRNA synthetase